MLGEAPVAEQPEDRPVESLGAVQPVQRIEVDADFEPHVEGRRGQLLTEEIADQDLGPGGRGGQGGEHEGGTQSAHDRTTE
jgi:hypothetical protein